MRSRIGRRAAWTCALVACAAGAVVSWQLSELHIRGGFGPDSFLGRMCEEGTASCDAVIKSKWGTFLRMPTAVWGMMYFASIGLWYLLAGLPNRAGRWWQLPAIVATGGGLAIAAGLAFIMFFRLPTWCPLCSVTHAASLLLFAASLLMWPRAPKAASVPDGAASPAAAPPVAGVGMRPGLARAASAGLGAALGVLAVHQNFFLRLHRAEEAQARATLANWSAAFAVEGGDPRALETLRLRPDDAVRGDPNGQNILVVFSDFECPMCGAFTFFWKKEIEPHARGKVRMVFRYFPMNTACNPAISTTLHERSCEAAAVAEAARLQGGPEAFWKMHDELFLNQLRGKRRLSPIELAERIGLNAGRLERDMNSPRVRDRIREDVALGKSVGVRGTPFVFLNGRRVDTSGPDPRWRRFLDSLKPTATAPTTQAE